MYECVWRQENVKTEIVILTNLKIGLRHDMIRVKNNFLLYVVQPFSLTSDDF